MAAPGRREDSLTVLLFALALAVPLANTHWHPSPTDRRTENRALAPRPPPLAQAPALEPWLRAWDKFMSDHFGGRDACIRAYHRTHLAVFGVTGLHGVLAGRDGWLYYTGNSSMEAVRGVLPPDPGCLDLWTTKLDDRRAWLADRGIPFVYVPAPDKHTIHPEHLPATIRPAGGRTRLDALLERLARAGVEAVDLRPALRAAAAAGPVYLVNDSHWTDRGASVGAAVVAARLAAHVTLRPAPRHAFTRGPPPPGDLSIMLGLADELPELADLAQPPPPLLSALGVAPPDARPRVLVLHDSFGEFARFLSEQVTVECHATSDLDPDLVSTLRPDAVVCECVERYLNEPPLRDRAIFGEDRALRAAFARAPVHRRLAGLPLPPLALPAGQYAVLRAELERDEPGLAVLGAGGQTFERMAPRGRGVVYLVAGAATPVEALGLRVLGSGDTRVHSLELATGLAARDLLVPGERLDEPLNLYAQDLSWTAPGSLPAGQPARLALTARNPAVQPWLPDGRAPVSLALRWLAAGGRTPAAAPVTVPLPATGPGVSTPLTVTVLTPPVPGRYVLRATCVQEGAGAFTDRGGRPGDLAVDVR